MKTQKVVQISTKRVERPTVEASSTQTPEHRTVVHRSSNATDEAKVVQGRRSWSILHRYCGCDPMFFEAWLYTIPAMCDCRNEFKKILEGNHPDFSSPDAFFRWGVLVHNLVNAKLQKPEVSIEEALAIWRADCAPKVHQQHTS